MKLLKQTLVILLIVLSFTGFDISIYQLVTKKYINDSSDKMKANSIVLDEYLPFDDDSKIVKIDSSYKLLDDFPIIDGAAALYPVFSAFVNATYPASSVEFDGNNFTSKSALQYRNTRGAYKAVVDGDVDIIFVAKPSEEQLQYANDNNVELEMVAIGYEAFVFIVNKNNPVDNLTVDEVKKIYSGEYTNWKQVGGDNSLIDAVQRNEGSGSQTAMLSFMGGTKMKRNPFGFFGRSIGYSYRYYVTGLVKNPNVKMISLNGVYPNKENIISKAYPIVGSIYAVYRKDNNNHNIRPLIEWILSKEGQKIIEESGYVSLY